MLERPTTTIRPVEDVQFELLLAIALVVMVIFPCPGGDGRPGVAVPPTRRHLRRHVAPRVQPQQPVADALTISTGFVVDDAIVMIENIARYIEQGTGRSRPR